MATSADVAAHAGLSRSTVSQVLNGRDHLFSHDTIARVRASAEALGYRPSLAGRTLARGTSDIVITLIPDVTFNPRLRELVDVVTEGLADAGYTNLLRFVGSGKSLDDAILGLKPFGVVSLARLTAAQNERLLAHGIQLVSQPESQQIAIDRSIGRLQAEHLIARGYETLAVAVPVSSREQPFAAPREIGAREWAAEHGVTVLPTLHIDLERGSSRTAITSLPRMPVGLAAYNDEIAISLLGAALHQSRDVPRDIGIVGIDNSPLARASTPSITTVDYDISYSGHGIVDMLLGRSGPIDDAVYQVEQRLSVIQGETTPN